MMVRVFLISGAHVDVPGRTLGEFSSAMTEAESRSSYVWTSDKVGNEILIRPQHVTHVAEYED